MVVCVVPRGKISRALCCVARRNVAEIYMQGVSRADDLRPSAPASPVPQGFNLIQLPAIQGLLTAPPAATLAPFLAVASLVFMDFTGEEEGLGKRVFCYAYQTRHQEVTVHKCLFDDTCGCINIAFSGSKFMSDAARRILLLTMSLFYNNSTIVFVRPSLPHANVICSLSYKILITVHNFLWCM